MGRSGRSSRSRMRQARASWSAIRQWSATRRRHPHSPPMGQHSTRSNAGIHDQGAYPSYAALRRFGHAAAGSASLAHRSSAPPAALLSRLGVVEKTDLIQQLEAPPRAIIHGFDRPFSGTMRAMRPLLRGDDLQQHHGRRAIPRIEHTGARLPPPDGRVARGGAAARLRRGRLPGSVYDGGDERGRAEREVAQVSR